MNKQYTVSNTNIFRSTEYPVCSKICIFYYNAGEDINLIEGRRGVIIADDDECLGRFLKNDTDMINSYISSGGQVVIRKLDIRYI